jgi:hypothetical protein
MGKIALAFVALAALLVLPGGALAAKPQVTRFSEAYDFVIPAAEHDCGVDVRIVGEVRVVEQLFFDAEGNLVKAVAHVTDRWTETGPGGTVRGQAALSVVTTDIASVDGVESWIDTFNGLPVKFSVPGEGLIVRDVGTLSVARTLVLNDPDDPDDDVFTQEVRWDRGDHPTFYGPEGWGDAFCAAVTG